MKRLSDKEKIEVVDLYVNKKISSTKISKMYNVTPSAILSILKRRGVKIRKKIGTEMPKKYSVNFNIFDKIDSKNKAYWLGFLMGDVCIKGNSINLELSNKDYDHLVKFQKFIELNNYEIKSCVKNCSRITFSNKHMSNVLQSYGLIPNKQKHNIVTPNILDCYKIHFYRGLLDSDGWITTHIRTDNGKSQLEFGFSSYETDILYEIQNFFKQYLPRTCGYLCKRKRKNQQTSQLIIGGNRNFKIMGSMFYACGEKLTRKYNKYKEGLKMIS